MPHTTANSISLMNMLFLHVGYVYGYRERSHFIVFFLPLTACLELMLMTCCKSTFKSHKISVLSELSRESPIDFNFDLLGNVMREIFFIKIMLLLF